MTTNELDELVTGWHRHDRDDEIRAEGYLLAQEEVEAILDSQPEGSNKNAARLRAVEDWALAGRL